MCVPIGGCTRRSGAPFCTYRAARLCDMEPLSVLLIPCTCRSGEQTLQTRTTAEHLRTTVDVEPSIHLNRLEGACRTAGRRSVRARKSWGVGRVVGRPCLLCFF